MINVFHLSCLSWRLNDELLHYILKIVVRESCVLITKCQTVSKDDFQRLLSTVPVSKMCFDRSSSAFGFFSSLSPSSSLSTWRWNFYSCVLTNPGENVFCLCCAGKKRIISHSKVNHSVMLQQVYTWIYFPVALVPVQFKGTLWISILKALQQLKKSNMLLCIMVHTGWRNYQ